MGRTAPPEDARQLSRLKTGVTTPTLTPLGHDNHLAEGPAFANMGERIGGLVECERMVDVDVDFPCDT